ncbi:MAG: MT-A70 family methyltransferase [Candidatus Bathyarchaeia archaeon]
MFDKGVVAETRVIVVDEEFRKLVPHTSKQEYEALQTSVCKEGCRDRLVVWKVKRILLDGHSRYEICQKYGIPFRIVEKEFESRDEAKLWIIENQSARRNLTDYGRCLLALAKESILRNQSRERQRQGGRCKVRQNPDSAVDVKRLVAKEAGVSHDTIAKVKLILEKGTEEEKAQLSTPGSKLSIYSVYRRIRQDEMKTETPPFPEGRFAVVYADPPWSFRFTESPSRAIQNHYATMSLEALKNLPVRDIAKEDCVLLMWAPAPLLKQAIELVEAWGFSYCTGAIWDKERIGMGYYFRQQHEHLLVATKGSPPSPLPADRPASVLRAPRGRHSEKPSQCYELIEKMYPRFRKIELFARPTKPRPGWRYWGNEVPKSQLEADTKNSSQDTAIKEGRTQ